MSVSALHIVRPPAGPVVRGGQQCFEFLPIMVVAHPPRPKGPRRVLRALHRSLELPFPRWPRRSPGLKEFVPRRMLPGARPRSMGTHPMSKAAREEMKQDVRQLSRAGVYRRRPKTFAECKPGPCPWVSCRHHLKLDVDPITHSVKDNFPGVDIDEMGETCSLRVAQIVRDGEPMPLEQVGKYANITMERARQLEKEGLASMKRALKKDRHL